MAKKEEKEIKDITTEPKRKIKLQRDPLNPDEEVKIVWYNFKKYEIKLGVEVEVPETIYNILVETENY